MSFRRRANGLTSGMEQEWSDVVSFSHFVPTSLGSSKLAALVIGVPKV